MQQQVVAPAEGWYRARQPPLGAQPQASLAAGLEVIKEVLEAEKVVEPEWRLGTGAHDGAQVGGKQPLGEVGVAQRISTHQQAGSGVLRGRELGRNEAALALGLHKFGAHELSVVGELLEQQARLAAVGLAQYVLGAAADGIGHEGELGG